jgi:hypothetical protein
VRTSSQSFMKKIKCNSSCMPMVMYIKGQGML